MTDTLDPQDISEATGVDEDDVQYVLEVLCTDGWLLPRYIEWSDDHYFSYLNGDSQ